jgi:hypothetical protein
VFYLLFLMLILLTIWIDNIEPSDANFILGVVRDQSLQIVELLGTRNWCCLGSAFTATRKIKCCLYKITYVHGLKQPDYAARIHFYNWLQQNVHDRNVDPQLLVITIETLLQWTCPYPKCRLWSEENYHAIQKMPLHHVRIVVCCKCNELLAWMIFKKPRVRIRIWVIYWIFSELRTVSQNLFTSCESCLKAKGGHF